MKDFVGAGAGAGAAATVPPTSLAAFKADAVLNCTDLFKGDNVVFCVERRFADGRCENAVAARHDARRKTETARTIMNQSRNIEQVVNRPEINGFVWFNCSDANARSLDRFRPLESIVIAPNASLIQYDRPFLIYPPGKRGNSFQIFDFLIVALCGMEISSTWELRLVDESGEDRAIERNVYDLSLDQLVMQGKASEDENSSCRYTLPTLMLKETSNQPAEIFFFISDAALSLISVIIRSNARFIELYRANATQSQSQSQVVEYLETYRGVQVASNPQFFDHELPLKSSERTTRWKLRFASIKALEAESPLRTLLISDLIVQYNVASNARPSNSAAAKPSADTKVSDASTANASFPSNSLQMLPPAYQGIVEMLESRLYQTIDHLLQQRVSPIIERLDRLEQQMSDLREHLKQGDSR